MMNFMQWIRSKFRKPVEITQPNRHERRAIAALQRQQMSRRLRALKGEDE